MSEEQNQEVSKNQERFEHKVKAKNAFDAGKKASKRRR